jgi:hypothetical protein
MTEENPQTENTERIFRKTVEVIERPFYLSPLAQKRQRRKSPIKNRCDDLMEALWEDGYRKEIPWTKLKQYLVSMIGGFRSTLTDYLGTQDKVYRSHGREGVLKSKGKPGYLEEFGFIERKSPKIVSLIHERVNRDYHYVQGNVVNFSLSNCGKDSVETEAPIGAVQTRDGEERDTKREREVQSLHENVKTVEGPLYGDINGPELTAEELRILGAAKKEGPK